MAAIPASRSHAAVPSVLASSTTISSKSRNVCASMLATARANCWRRLCVGRITETARIGYTAVSSLAAGEFTVCAAVPR